MKSANVIARVNPDIKKQAETIIRNLGLNTSTVINALYRQIILCKGIPFEISEEPICVDDMSEDELGKLLEERIANHNPEDDISFEEAFDELFKKIEDDTKKLRDSLIQRSTRRSEKN